MALKSHKYNQHHDNSSVLLLVHTMGRFVTYLVSLITCHHHIDFSPKKPYSQTETSNLIQVSNTHSFDKSLRRIRNETVVKTASRIFYSFLRF
jgi:hypothetical protein